MHSQWERKKRWFWCKTRICSDYRAVSHVRCRPQVGDFLLTTAESSSETNPLLIRQRWLKSYGPLLCTCTTHAQVFHRLCKLFSYEWKRACQNDHVEVSMRYQKSHEKACLKLDQCVETLLLVYTSPPIYSATSGYFRLCQICILPWMDPHPLQPWALAGDSTVPSACVERKGFLVSCAEHMRTDTYMVLPPLLVATKDRHCNTVSFAL